jgi:hypothetical protein
MSENEFVIVPSKMVSALTFSAHGVVVVSIEQDGRILWRGREVETDDDFRAAMLDLSVTMRAVAFPLPAAPRSPAGGLSAEEVAALEWAETCVEGARRNGASGICNTRDVATICAALRRLSEAPGQRPQDRGDGRPV